jgi:uncharacterized Ntn-hydrolase superfamily protein
MFKVIYFLTATTVCPLLTQAQFFTSKNPFAHTFSIVARDENTGEMAVGVQSHWFSVGTGVSWGEAGVGVVATQSFTNKSFGPEGLRLLREGKTPAEALKILLDQDEGREFRQVSIMDSKGNVATHTGASCIAEAGHIEGEGFSVQANMMLNATVWDAMAKAYSTHKNLPLPERVLVTLEAAQEAGGDIRGKQSAALIVVKGTPAEAWEDPYLDLRVDDNAAPLVELRRLLKVFRAYEHMNKGDVALEVNDMKTALAEYNTAQEMFPNNLEMKYWTAITLINNGELEKGKDLLKRVFEADDNWRILTKRLPDAGLLQVDDTVLQSLLAL